jgi:hypothetical protein
LCCVPSNAVRSKVLGLENSVQEEDINQQEREPERGVGSASCCRTLLYFISKRALPGRRVAYSNAASFAESLAQLTSMLSVRRLSVGKPRF